MFMTSHEVQCGRTSCGRVCMHVCACVRVCMHVYMCREIDVLKQLTLQDVLGLYRDVVLDVWQRRRISIEL